jgi:HSP20 family protein
MADPQQPTQNTDKTSATRRPSEAGEGTRVEGEPRSFEQSAESIRKAGQSNVEAARETARAVAEGGRKLVEAGQQTAQEMGQTWRNSLEPFTAMQVEMNRRFDDLWRQVTGGGLMGLNAGRLFSGLGANSLFGLPASDLRETDSAYQLMIELPGLRREDVDVSVRGDSLVITGQKTEEKEDATAAYRLSERRFGRFQRSFAIPQDVDRSRIEATFRDGVLRISLPKSAHAASQGDKIEIKS